MYKAIEKDEKKKKKNFLYGISNISHNKVDGDIYELLIIFFNLLF